MINTRRKTLRMYTGKISIKILLYCIIKGRVKTYADDKLSLHKFLSLVVKRGAPLLLGFIPIKGGRVGLGCRDFALKVKLDRRLYDSVGGRNEVTLAGGSWRTLTENEAVCNPLERL